jgi:hypothetical protein
MRNAIIAGLLVMFAFAAIAAPAIAGEPGIYHGGVHFGSVAVEPGQIVKGDLTVIGGDATIEGIVDGDLNVIGGNVYERPGAMITGQVNAIGGDVTGDVMPWTTPNESVATVDFKLLWKIASAVIAVLFFLVFPVRTRIALDRLERHPGMSAAVGLLGWVAVLPVAFLLLCTILLIPFIAVEAVALVAAVFLGKAALALLVGRRLVELIKPHVTPTPIVALLVGLVLITAAELVPFAGSLVSVFVLLIGLGSAILAFTGEALVRPVASLPQSQPPVSGPPMPAA